MYKEIKKKKKLLKKIKRKIIIRYDTSKQNNLFGFHANLNQLYEYKQ